MVHLKYVGLTHSSPVVGFWRRLTFWLRLLFWRRLPFWRRWASLRRSDCCRCFDD